MERAAVDLSLHELTKRFPGPVMAVDGLSLDVKAGDLVSLLGPSGCGKTTTLRMIAGFETPDAGHVLLRGEDITTRPVHRRDIGIVFQNYSLFPHMSVGDNVAYGLKIRRVGRMERDRRVGEALELVRMAGLSKRYPRELSGGQQQRVALARALVIRPAVLLLDEPLSNLDAKLRNDMRLEIRHLQQQLGITTVLVTHDQEEALMTSDIIAVMNAGKIEQVGGPRDLYLRPTSPFVASFVGEGNQFRGRVVARDGSAATIEGPDGVRVIAQLIGDLDVGAGVVARIRPEAINIYRPGESLSPSHTNNLKGEIEEVTYLGPTTSYSIRVSPSVSLRVSKQNQSEHDEALRVGTLVIAGWQPTGCHALPTE